MPFIRLGLELSDPLSLQRMYRVSMVFAVPTKEGSQSNVEARGYASQLRMRTDYRRTEDTVWSDSGSANPGLWEFWGSLRLDNTYNHRYHRALHYGCDPPALPSKFPPPYPHSNAIASSSLGIAFLSWPQWCDNMHLWTKAFMRKEIPFTFPMILFGAQTPWILSYQLCIYELKKNFYSNSTVLSFHPWKCVWLYTHTHTHTCTHTHRFMWNLKFQ